MPDAHWGFHTPLSLVFMNKPIDGKWFLVGSGLEYTAKDGELYRVLIGVRTDFASIPRGLRWLIPRIGLHGKAAVLHDYLCEYKVIPRKEADKIFLEAMESLGVGWLKRYTMYRAVAAYTLVSRKK